LHKTALYSIKIHKVTLWVLLLKPLARMFLLQRALIIIIAVIIFTVTNLMNPPAVLQVNKQHFNTVGGEVELTKNFKDVDNDFTYG